MNKHHQVFFWPVRVYFQDPTQAVSFITPAM
jgi:hypothetical protein